jgi:hypothetical protein
MSTILGKVTQQDLCINQRGKFELTVAVVDSAGAALPMSGWTAKMEIRPSRGDAGTALDIYNTGGEITVVPGQVQIDVPGSQTAGYTWDQAVYDLYIIDTSNQPYRILEGLIKVDHSVTAVLP